MRQTMKTFLFDDQGDTWDATSRKLANALCASIAGTELANYAIRNLGYIAVSESNGSVRVRLRPAVVSQMAFSALLYWLHDRLIERVLLSFLGGEWTHELMRSREEAVKRLMTRVTFNADDRDGDFLRRTRPLHAMPSASPLRALLRFWSESGGKYDRERLSPVLDKALDRRFVLVEAAGNSSSLYFKDVGRGLTTLAEFWLSHATTLRVEDQPDYAYGKWVSSIYREVLASGEPSFEEIDAIINWPEDPYRKSYRYRRLVVPFSGERNSTMVLSATLMDLDVNLRRKPC
jgi:hypothetical protein